VLETQIKGLAEKQLRLLLQDAPEISFRQLITLALPPYLWDYLNVVLNPHLGGVTRVGKMDLDFTDPELIANLEPRLMASLSFTSESLGQLIFSAIESRLQFILDPATALARLILERQTSLNVPSKDIRTALEGITKVVHHWNPMVAKAAEVIIDYLARQPNLLISEVELVRLLRSAIEKEFSQNPMPSVEASLLVLAELTDSGQDEKGAPLDCTEAVNQILVSRGLNSWTPALQVERELLGKPLDLDVTLKTLSRLRLYREKGILKSETEAAGSVEEELAGFTSIFEGTSS